MTNEGEYKDTLTYLANMADSGSITVSSTGDYPYYPYATGTYQPPTYFKTFDELHESSWERIIKPKKGDDNMRYLYEVILVNPKNDNFVVKHIVAKTETSAMMQAYDENDFSDVNINFDDLKTSCRVLMEWKKKESLKKAIETIKKAVE